MALMAVSAVTSTSQNVLIRLAATTLHPFEVAVFRNLFAVMALLPLALRGGRELLVTRRFGLHLLRAVLNGAAMLCFFTALTLEPLAKVAALNFITPLLATFAAIMVLGERPNRHRWMALGIGLAGALMIVRPGMEVISTGALLVFASSLLWAFAMSIIKLLTRTESSVTITLYASILMLPITLVPALFFWRTPTLVELGLMAVLAALGVASHLLIAEAFRGAEASYVLPVGFTKLVWASVLGYFVFHEIPEPVTLIGGLIICAGVFYSARMERAALNRQGSR